MIGAVVGLVTITPAAGFVTPMGALAMGVLRLEPMLPFACCRVFELTTV